MVDRSAPHPTAEAILAYLDGADLPQVAAALESATEDAALAAEYATLQGGLIRSLYRHDCPPTQSLGDYALQVLPAAERVAIAAHIADCPHCTGELAQIRTYLTIEADPPPLRLVDRGRQLIAILAPPPATAPLATLRGASVDEAQSYEVEDIAIILDPLAGAPRGRGTLTGLVVRERDDSLLNAPVTLTARDGSAQTTTIDEFGNFAFEEIAAGDYQLEVLLGGDTIVINDLRIGR